MAWHYEQEERLNEAKGRILEEMVAELLSKQGKVKEEKKPFFDVMNQQTQESI